MPVRQFAEQLIRTTFQQEMLDIFDFYRLRWDRDASKVLWQFSIRFPRQFAINPHLVRFVIAELHRPLPLPTQQQRFAVGSNPEFDVGAVVPGSREVVRLYSIEFLLALILNLGYGGHQVRVEIGAND